MRALVNMIVEPSTSKYATMFPYPMLIMKIKNESDELMDLNLEAYQTDKNEKVKIINNCIDVLNTGKYTDVIVCVGEYAPDGYYSEWIEYFLTKIKVPIKIMGPYTDTSQKNAVRYIETTKISNPDLCVEFIPTDYDISDVIIPLEMIERYPKPEGKLKANIKVTVGCPRTCKMCPVVIIYKNRRPRYEYKDVNKSLQIIKNYYDVGVRFFNFTDDGLSADIKNFKKLLRGLKELNLKGVTFFDQEGFEVFCYEDEEVCQLLKDLKWHEPKMGMENIKPEFLKTIGKYYIDTAHAIKALENIAKYKLKVRCFFLLGSFQSKNDAIDNIRFIIKNNLDVRCNIYRRYENDGMEKDLPVLVTEETLRKLKALAYSAAWWKLQAGYDIFDSNDFQRYIKDFGASFEMIGDKVVYNLGEIKENRGFKTAKLISGLEYMLSHHFNLNIEIEYDDATKKITNIKKKNGQNAGRFFDDAPEF